MAVKKTEEIQTKCNSAPERSLGNNSKRYKLGHISHMFSTGDLSVDIVMVTIKKQEGGGGGS